MQKTEKTAQGNDGLVFFSVVSLIREDSELGKMLERMREKLRRARIPFETPKMGDHITLLSPFMAPESFGLGFAKGLRFSKTDEVLTVEGWRYLDSDHRAIAVLLKPSDHLRKIVDDLRVSIPSSWWKFPPDRFPLLMHATAAQTPKDKKSFHARIERLPEEKHPKVVVTEISVRMPQISIVKKNEQLGKWPPVHF